MDTKQPATKITDELVSRAICVYNGFMARLDGSQRASMRAVLEDFVSSLPAAAYTLEQIREAVINALVITYSQKLAERKANEVESLLTAPKPKTIEENIADVLYESLGHAAGMYNVPKLAKKIARLTAEVEHCAIVEAERDTHKARAEAAEAQLKVLSAPVNTEEVSAHEHHDDWGVTCWYANEVTDLIADRLAAAQKGGK